MKLVWGLAHFGAILLTDGVVVTLKRYQALLLALILFLTLSGVFLQNTLALQDQRQFEFGQPTLLPISQLSPTPLSYIQAENQFQAFQLISQLQPTHRDTLINLALLAQQLHRPAEAAAYWQQAQAIDPNAPLFQAR